MKKGTNFLYNVLSKTKNKRKVPMKDINEMPDKILGTKDSLKELIRKQIEDTINNSDAERRSAPLSWLMFLIGGCSRL